MKKDMAAFLQEVQRKSLRQRRIAALFLALSLTVTSGVTWALHGVGITLANEAAADTEEHVHSDACYAKTLICGMEEDENHTHSDECYADLLICTDGKEDNPEETEEETAETDEEPAAPNEVIIDTVIGDPVAEPEDDAEDPEAEEAAKAQAIADAEEKAIADFETESDVELQKALKFTGTPMLRAAAKGVNTPPQIETIDNNAEGIKFTLFDYGNDAVDSSGSHYNNPNLQGINTGKTRDTDILFFAYGTPPPHSDEEIGTTVNEQGETVTVYKPGVHDKNYYSGDYNITSPQSGNRPFQGIVQDKLVNGYPVLVDSGHSLEYLFSPKTTVDGVDQSSYKTVYQDVNHLLRRETEDDANPGFLIYNSDNNYAYYNQETNSFEVYNTTFDISNKNHHSADDPAYNYGEKDPFKIGFFPFNEYDDTKKDPDWNADPKYYNHHFGMTMEANFLYPTAENLKEPITFKYSGDDDMWVFVDDQLVLDIGGIHEPTGGMIDFTNGLVWTQDNDQGKTLETVKNENGFTDEAWAALPKPIGVNTASTADATNRWIVTPLDWSKIGTNKEGPHNIKMFYLERGGCYSNLAMEMNLPTLKPLTIQKKVDYQDHLESDYDSKEYTFQVYEQVNNELVIPTDEQLKNPITLRAGEKRTFPNLGIDRKFTVREINVNPTIYESVTINDTETISMGSQGPENEIGPSNPKTLTEVDTYSFENKIREDKNKNNLKVQKEWEGEGLNPSNWPDVQIKFKIYQTDSVTGQTRPVTLNPINGDQITRKKRTFVLNKSNNWTFSAEVPTRYGNHNYTYSVKELDVPDGYKVSYSTDNGTLVMTNVKNDSAKIHVEKAWENCDNPPAVTLKLKRRVLSYTPSNPTSLTVELYDAGGNLIGTDAIPVNAPENERVYKDGSVECLLYLPPGASVTSTDATSGVQVDVSGDFVEISKLQADQNLVKIYTDVPESILIEQFDFQTQEDMQRFSGRTASIAYDADTKYSTDGSLRVYGRSSDWNGVQIRLNPDLYPAGKTYTCVVYAKSDVAGKLQLSLEDRSEATVHYPPVSDAIYAEADTWVKLTGSFTIPAGKDPTKYFLYVQAPDNTNGQIWIDDFASFEGTGPVEVEPRTGAMSLGTAEQPIEKEVYSINFGGSLTDGWGYHASGSGNITCEDEYIRIYGRSQTYSSIQRNFDNVLLPGHTYKLKITGQHDGTENPSDYMKFTLNYTSDASHYKAVAEVGLPSSSPTNSTDKWVIATGTGTQDDPVFKIPEGTTTVRGYFETNDTKDFRVRGLQIYEVVDNQVFYPDPINLDGESATRLRIMDDSYDEDTIFNNAGHQIVLDGTTDTTETTPWSASWSISNLEEPYKLYQYYIEEISIANAADQDHPITINDPDALGRIYSSDDNYLITYSGNDIAANTENNPIVVTNKYIWYKLPATGGIGTGGICAAGVVLALTGFIGGIALKKREGRYG